jgi:hypothetical protein
MKQYIIGSWMYVQLYLFVQSEEVNRIKKTDLSAICFELGMERR